MKALSTWHVRKEPEVGKDHQWCGSPWIGVSPPTGAKIEVGPMTVTMTDPSTGETRTVHGFAARGRTVPPEVLDTLRQISSGRITVIPDPPADTEPLPPESLPTANDLRFIPLGGEPPEGIEEAPRVSRRSLISTLIAALLCGAILGLIVRAIIN
ncbi:MAG: hypothetical protein JNJ94_07715 [Chlorobi bacterium]|nr:hypothetical protein [Chlorobiota bacterium]